MGGCSTVEWVGGVVVWVGGYSTVERVGGCSTVERVGGVVVVL